jgi:tyrosyl-tRNA synthetase
MNVKSKFLQQFIARGFFAQCTNLEELDLQLQNAQNNNKPLVAYIGFDCTAPSLHIGSLMQIMMLRLWQKYGNLPIILLGGGTTQIGDPSGKDESRNFLSLDQININTAGILQNVSKFLDFNRNSASNSAILVNNQDWLLNLNYLNFLRDIGKHFSINKMLSFDSVKLRLQRDQPLSFLEFNYMLLQAYDFLQLYQKHSCTVQIGGSDQWGNIVNGTELIRKFYASQNQEHQKVFGLTSPLITTSDGKKMGKTANGAVWLSENLSSPFDFFQYFRNVSDADVERFLKLFTDLDLEQIAYFCQNNNINQNKEILAFEVTKICHTHKQAQNVLEQARAIFISKENFPIFSLNLDNANKKLIDILLEIKVSTSKNEAKKLIQGNAVKINQQVVSDVFYGFNEPCEFELSVGKKKFFKIILL